MQISLGLAPDTDLFSPTFEVSSALWLKAKKKAQPNVRR